MSAKLSDEAIHGLLADLEGWEFSNNHLTTTFNFKDFSEALGFMMRTGLVCEKLNHHPNWYNVYGKVDVQLWTHDQQGVTGLDIKLATAMNEIAGRGGSQ